MNNMLDRLQGKYKKKGYFTSAQTSVSYPTGFLPLDYANGYYVDVFNDSDELLERRESLGIVGGSFITTIGKTGVAKTTLNIQIIASILSKFPDNAFAIIYDLEQSLTMTRIKRITNMSQKDLRSKIVLRQEKNYIEDIFETIQLIAKEKEENREDYMYNTGVKDEFGDEIVAYIPTVILMDSIPTMSTRDNDERTEMEG